MILMLTAHVLLSFCVRIGAFGRFSCFYASAGFSSSMHIFYRDFCSKKKCGSSRLMAADVEKPRVVLR